MLKLEQEKLVEAEKIAKAKKLYKMLKTRASRRSSRLFGKVGGSGGGGDSGVKAVKVKTAVVKSKTNKRQFVQPRQLPAPAAAAACTVKKGPGGLTLVEPFTFATDKRVSQQEHAVGVPAAANAAASLTTAELAQHFMRDSRSHGVRTNCFLDQTICLVAVYITLQTFTFYTPILTRPPLRQRRS